MTMWVAYLNKNYHRISDHCLSSLFWHLFCSSFYSSTLSCLFSLTSQHSVFSNCVERPKRKTHKNLKRRNVFIEEVDLLVAQIQTFVLWSTDRLSLDRSEEEDRRDSESVERRGKEGRAETSYKLGNFGREEEYSDRSRSWISNGREEEKERRTAWRWVWGREW